ncbi:hypothetical protein [Cardinium endosymbiont of Tipula unca]|uniref:hypothetical protein n=1 Tax=Cardinium endosymbiont of Tipula unca TaxID=3066216 RepID=UPI0030CD6310
MLAANSMVYPAYADLDQDGSKPEKEPTAFELSGSLTMTPSLAIKDDAVTSGNDTKVKLACKADVPKVLCDKNAEINVAVGLNKKDVKLNEATVVLAKMLTVGYTDSIFAYEKSNGGLPITADASIFQIKLQHTFGCFQLGYALESPVELQVGKFDKTSPAKTKPAEKKYPEDNQAKKDEKENKKLKVNQLDDIKDDKCAFKIKNNIPAFGLSLGIVTDRLNIGLSGLGRWTDYTHDDTSAGQKKTTTGKQLTYGGNLGIQYEVVPKKFTVTGQATYVAGLGDYVSGLAAIQDDKKREEMCAAYYTDPAQNKLRDIEAWGLGGTLEFCATPELTFSLAGAYLTALEDSNKPAIAFKNRWTVSPKVAYKLSQRWTVSAEYSAAKENKVSAAESKKLGHEVSGSIGFSF